MFFKGLLLFGGLCFVYVFYKVLGCLSDGGLLLFCNVFVCLFMLRFLGGCLEGAFKIFSNLSLEYKIYSTATRI